MVVFTSIGNIKKRSRTPNKETIQVSGDFQPWTTSQVPKQLVFETIALCRSCFLALGNVAGPTAAFFGKTIM